MKHCEDNANGLNVNVAVIDELMRELKQNKRMCVLPNYCNACSTGNNLVGIVYFLKPPPRGT